MRITVQAAWFLVVSISHREFLTSALPQQHRITPRLFTVQLFFAFRFDLLYPVTYLHFQICDYKARILGLQLSGFDFIL